MVGPWPVRTAIGAVAGTAGAHLGAPLWPLLICAALCGAVVLPLLSPVGKGRGISRSAPRVAAVLILPLLVAALCHFRYGEWSSRPNPLEPMFGDEVRLSGTSDGRLLRLDRPPGTRVAVAPVGALPAGRVEVSGTLLEPEGKRNPGGFDYRAYLLRRGVQGQLLVAEIHAAQPAVRWRDRLQAGVRTGMPPPAAALVEAMTLGIRDELGALRESFAAAGLAHVLALSGLHVGLLLGAAGWLLSPLGGWRYPLLILLTAGFVLLVGPTPSVVRAALMAAAVLVGLWAGAGRLEPWPALGLAATVTLLVRPAWLLDASFVLSYGAVAGILLFALPLTARTAAALPARWRRVGAVVLGSLITSAAAQALTLTTVASSFGTVPLFSPLVNLVAIPVASLLVPLGFAAGLLGLLAPHLAATVNLVTAPLAELLIRVAQAGAQLPAVIWGEVEWRGHLYFAAASTALALAANGLLRPRRALLVVLGAMLLSASTPSSHPPPEVVAIDVGQGDSFLLRFPGRVEVLVDGGGTPFSDYDVGGNVVVPALRALGVDELELVVATHADADHIEGLSTVLREVPVQKLVYGVAERERPVFAQLMRTARSEGVEVASIRRGERIVLGRAVLEVLNPPASPSGVSNDDSVALAVKAQGGKTALLLGDISSRVEAKITPPRADILVAPHHGSADSTSERLLRVTSPRYVIVSVGRNSYGHPSRQVLERAERRGARVYATSERGAIRLSLGARRSSAW